MKINQNIRIALVGLMALSLSACNKFLDVTPKTETPKDVLFNSEAGFKDALTGVYIQMKAEPAYGEALTYGWIEYLTSSWTSPTNSWPYRLGLFQYEDEEAERAIQVTYGQLYKVIASANAILDQIDTKKSVFKTSGLYEMIKGECLAIRAYCHFDILRLFGPIPTDPSTGSMLPYVTHLSKDINPHLSYVAFQQALMTDLTSAEALLKDVDPILEYSIADLSRPGPTNTFNPADSYMAYRNLRMNYYAVRALQARVHLWVGNTDQAFENAQFVIDAINEDGTSKFYLGTASDMTAGDYVLTTEHIFGLYDFDMLNKFEEDFTSGLYYKGTSATQIQNQLFGNTGTDIRETYLWQLITLDNSARRYIIRKYEPKEEYTSLANDYRRRPLLRLSEMYLIAAETAPLAEAQGYWDTFRTARNLESATLPIDPLQRQLEIVKEYRKEFYAEGQAFYTYKRLNADKAHFLFIPNAATINYLIPLPKTETINLN